MSRRARSRRRKGWPRSRRSRSTNGGQSSKLPGSGRRRNEGCDGSALDMKMDGKTLLITGSTDGVGRYVATRLASAGAKVLIHGRNEARAETLVDEIKRAGHAAPTFYQADLSSLAGVRQL